MEYDTLPSLGLAVLLVGSLTGVGVAAQHSMTSQSEVTEVTERQTEADHTATPLADRGADALQRGPQVNLSEVNVSALEAVQLAQNETDGKAVVVTLTAQNGTPAFNVTVLQENLSVSQVTVDATNRTVTSVRRNVTTVRTEFLGGEAFDYAELRTAGDAIRLIQNQTNGTVVNVGIRRGELVYGVVLRTPEGRQTQALVAATNGAVLGIRSTNATAPTTTTA